MARKSPPKRQQPRGEDAPSGGPVEAMRVVAAGAARLLATPDGPRLAALAFDGFDTHLNEGATQGSLAPHLQGSTPHSRRSKRILGKPGRIRS